jgi:hypothetical protein
VLSLELSGTETTGDPLEDRAPFPVLPNVEWAGDFTGVVQPASAIHAESAAEPKPIARRPDRTL